MLPKSRTHSKPHIEPERSLRELRHGAEVVGRAASPQSPQSKSNRRVSAVAKSESVRPCPSLTAPLTATVPSIAAGGAEPCVPAQDGRGIHCRLAQGGSIASTAKENREKAAKVVRMQLREAFESVTLHFMAPARMRKHGNVETCKHRGCGELPVFLA